MVRVLGKVGEVEIDCESETLWLEGRREIEGQLPTNVSHPNQGQSWVVLKPSASLDVEVTH